MILAIVSYLIKVLLIFLFILLITFLSLATYVKLKIEPVRRECTSTVRLDGKIALVTGGNQGIGLETARGLASRGAHVVIACRDAAKATDAINDITATTGNKQVEYKPLDLSKFSSVRKFAEDFNKSYDRLDILVNNAGCGSEPTLTEDGNDVVMQVNYFGPFLLTNLLLDKLIASAPSRIIIVSSCLHNFAFALRVNNLHRPGFTGQLGRLVSYGNSKLCHILWMKALVKRLPEGVTVNTLHPGLIKTDIINTLPFFVRAIFHLTCYALLYRTAKEGAQTTLHLCVSEEVENVRGKYFMECKEGQYSKMANNDELVEQVWDKSLKVTSLSYS